MKRYLKFILMLTMLAAFSSPAHISAQEAELSVSIDYSGELVNVEYKSPLMYDTIVNVYMLEKSAEEYIGDFSKVIRFEQAECRKNGTCAVAMKFGNDLNGYYDIFAVPGGVLSAQASVKNKEEVYILGSGERARILSEINSASESEIGDKIFSELKDALHFEADACPDWKSTYLYHMKTADCGGAYKSFEQIDTAWKCSDYIYAIRTAQGAEKAEIEKSGEFLDIKNSDYVNYNQDFISMFVKRLNDNNIMSKTELERHFSETALLTAIAKRDLEGRTKALSEYESVLNLSNTAKQNIKNAGAANVLRQIGSKPLNDVKALADELEKTAAKLASGSSQGGAGSGTSSGGGNSGQKTVNIPAWTDKSASVSPITSARFSDVPSSHWAYDAIETLAGKSIVSGYGGNIFNPDGIISREEFIKIAVDAFGISADNEIRFNDVGESHWAQKYIRAGVAAGIVKGISENEFGIGQPITRQDMAVIVLNCMKYAGANVQTEAANSFGDKDEIAPYAEEAVGRISAMGIISGFEDGTFMPRGLLTRAQAARVIYAALGY